MNRQSKSGLLALVCVVLVAACGGGGGGGGGGAAAPSSSASSSTSSSSSVASSGSSASSSSSSASSVSSSSSSSSSAITLSQAGNPVYAELDGYKSWLSTSGDAAAKLAADKTKGDNIISWQMPHGGFYKNAVAVYNSPWNGSAKRSDWTGAGGVELGTIDNDATVSELLFLADVYKRSGDAKYRDAARKALDFLLTMQYSSGGFPQVYPARTGTAYSNHVTFNDDAMVRVLVLLDAVVKETGALDGDVFTTTQRSNAATAITKAVDYILAAQIVQAGVKTVWCAQHDPVDYSPKGARSYELPSKSGKESVLVTAFLMTRPQTPAIEAAVKAAIAWYKSDATQLKNTVYEKTNSKATKTTPFITQAGSTTWYRFYELNSDAPIFSGRLPNAADCSNPAPFATCTGKQSDIMAIEEERRYGYEWGGSYGTKLMTYSDSVGY